MPSARRQAGFAYFFVAAWPKSKAFGGTRPAGFPFGLLSCENLKKPGTPYNQVCCPTECPKRTANPSGLAFPA